MSEPLPLALPAPTIAVSLELPSYGARVQVGVPAGAQLLDVWRVGPSGTVAYVREAQARAVVGPTTAFAHDLEAPFGVPLTYTARVSLADGSQASQVSAAPFTLEPPSEDPWLTDLVRPLNSQPVVVESLAELAYDLASGVHRVLQRRTPVVTSDMAWTPTGELVFVTLDEASRERARDTFGTSLPVLLRTLPEQGVGNLYLSLTGWREQRVSRVATHPERRFVCSVVQVERPDPRLFAPLGALTYADVLSSWASYAAVKAANASYDALLWNYAESSGQSLAVPWPPADV